MVLLCWFRKRVVVHGRHLDVTRSQGLEGYAAFEEGSTLF